MAQRRQRGDKTALEETLPQHPLLSPGNKAGVCQKERPGNYLSSFTKAILISTKVQCGCLHSTTPAVNSETRKIPIGGDKGLGQAQPLSLHFQVFPQDFNSFFLKRGELDRGRLID